MQAAASILETRLLLKPGGGSSKRLSPQFL
jgi:hypothetical protein